MTEWTCPRCEGGFPKPYSANGKVCCPWCGESIGNMFITSTAQRERLERWYGVG